MKHNGTNRKPRNREKTLCRGLLCVAVLSLCAGSLSGCDQGPRVRLELVSRAATEGPATAIAWDAAQQLVYVGAGETVTAFIETSAGQWQPQPGSAVTLPGVVTAIDVTSSRLYVASEGGVYAIDGQQNMAGSYVGPFGVQDLQVHGQNVHAVLNWHDGVYQCGLHVLTASELAKVGAIDEPVVIGFVCSPETVFNAVAVAPPLAYIAGDSVCGEQYAKAFLGTVDVSQPADLQALGKVELDYLPANALVLAGDYAYVAGTGLYVVDVSDPNAPQAVMRFPTPRELTDVVLSLPFVYVSDVTGRVQAIDVSNPAAPRAASAWFETGFAVHELRVNEPYLYAANDEGGLAVLRATR
jgi:hypothetical protein